VAAPAAEAVSGQAEAGRPALASVTQRCARVQGRAIGRSISRFRYCPLFPGSILVPIGLLRTTGARDAHAGRAGSVRAARGVSRWSTKRSRDNACGGDRRRKAEAADVTGRSTSTRVDVVHRRNDQKCTYRAAVGAPLPQSDDEPQTDPDADPTDQLAPTPMPPTVLPSKKCRPL
jgi:hypothetical protein